ncbi:MAG: hypothetical protein GQ553_04090 [Nitrosomonadaceae bacterium]|jgi:hypothetical protein|nr:hypothetical protein [Nitrosomonadaceae bacterium]
MVVVLRYEANNKAAEKQFCKRAVQLLRYVKPLEKSGKLLLCCLILAYVN